MVEPTPPAESISATQRSKLTVPVNPADGQLQTGPRFVVPRFFVFSVVWSMTLHGQVQRHASDSKVLYELSAAVSNCHA